MIYNREWYESEYRQQHISACGIFPSLAVWNVNSVLDVGCGLGQFLEPWYRSGVSDILGLDLPEAGFGFKLPEKYFHPIDLNQDQNPAIMTFELVLCLEVAEHLNPNVSDKLVEFLCESSESRILFGAATPGQGGHGHINEQTLEYWEKLFNKRGWQQRYKIREQFPEWVSPWYRTNTMLFEK